jgi:hypothetical protein
MALVSADGFEREHAIEDVQLRRSTVALIALRATEWVKQVRHAALLRLAEARVSILLDVLPLLEVLTQERTRADDLDALIEQWLSDGDLRAATHADNVLARRAGWRRLVASVLVHDRVGRPGSGGACGARRRAGHRVSPRGPERDAAPACP